MLENNNKKNNLNTPALMGLTLEGKKGGGGQLERKREIVRQTDRQRDRDTEREVLIHCEGLDRLTFLQRGRTLNNIQSFYAVAYATTGVSEANFTLNFICPSS